jgi:hypothetical protein
MTSTRTTCLSRVVSPGPADRAPARGRRTGRHPSGGRDISTSPASATSPTSMQLNNGRKEGVRLSEGSGDATAGDVCVISALHASPVLSRHRPSHSPPSCSLTGTSSTGCTWPHLYGINLAANEHRLREAGGPEAGRCSHPLQTARCVYGDPSSTDRRRLPSAYIRAVPSGDRAGRNNGRN